MTNNNESDCKRTSDISTFELFSLVWRKKITIFFVVAIFGILGTFYVNLVPGNYVGEFVLRKPHDVYMSAYQTLNDRIREYDRELLLVNEQGFEKVSQFEFSADVFKTDMIRELQNYQIYEDVLKEFVPSFKNMSENELQHLRIKLKNKFTVSPVSERSDQTLVTFSWPNEFELVNVLTIVLEKSWQKVNSDRLKTIENLVKNLELRNRILRERIRSELFALKEISDTSIKRKLHFLKEQSQIARELDLADNSLQQGPRESHISFIDNTDVDVFSEIAYLRGYKSLDKEISLLSARTLEQNYQMNPRVIELTSQLSKLEKDISAKQFREAVDLSPLTIKTNVFKISKASIYVRDERKIPFLISVFLILGAILSIAYILILDMMMRR